MTAKGTFEAKLEPLPPDDKAEGSTLGRLSIGKRFHGDLDATSVGQMLTATTDVKGSAGYVAVERVIGSLEGRRGSFALLHSGLMSAAGIEHSVRVVPDSGSGELKGLAGKMAIRIEGGQHSYEFEYTLPDGA